MTGNWRWIWILVTLNSHNVLTTTTVWQHCIPNHVTDQCFHLLSVPAGVTWSGAWEVCGQEVPGGTLASLDTDSRRDILKIGDRDEPSYVWLSGKRDLSHPQWLWSDGKPYNHGGNFIKVAPTTCTTLLLMLQLLQ